MTPTGWLKQGAIDMFAVSGSKALWRDTCEGKRIPLELTV